MKQVVFDFEKKGGGGEYLNILVLTCFGKLLNALGVQPEHSALNVL